MRRRTIRSLTGGAAGSLALGLSLTGVAPASAEVFEVRTESELRQAVADANANAGLDRIVLGASITFDGASAGEDGDGPEAGDLDVTDDLRVDGNGQTLDANGVDRVFDVSAEADLLLSDAILRNGAPQEGASGGLIRSAGTLAVDGSKLLDSLVSGTGASGGAIFNDGGIAVISTSRLRGNAAERAGGAIEANAGSTTLDKVALVGNTAGAAPGNGGGLHLTGAGDVTVTDSYVSDNRASSEGGGLWNSAAGTMTVKRTELLDNIARGADADNGGGALFNDGGELVVRGSELSSNEASGASGSGGGILSLGSLSVKGTLVSDNLAKRAGGGIEQVGSTADFTEVDLVDNNVGANPGNGGGLHVGGEAETSFSGGSVIGNRAANEGGGLWNGVDATMTVTGAELVGNRARGDAADSGGGGIYNDGELAVSGSSLLGNDATGTSGSGGGVLNNLGDVSITESTLLSNRSQRAGGGIETNAGTVFLKRVDLLANSTGWAPGNGGGLHVTGAGDVEYRQGSVKGNKAASEGGGLWNSATGSMLVKKVELKKNAARGDAADNGGGALFNDGGLLQVKGSTLAKNRAVGAAGSGGGIFNNAGDLEVQNTVVKKGRAIRAGGGIETLAGTVDLYRVDLMENKASANPGNGGGFHTSGAGVVSYDRGSVLENVAAAEGGGLWNSSTGTMTVTDVRIKRNDAPLGKNVFNQPGGIFTVDGDPVPEG